MATASKKPAPAATKAGAKPAAKPAATVTKANTNKGVVTAPKSIGNTSLMRGEDIPDYIKRDGGRGNEDVGMEDQVIPRLEIVQALSPCLKKNDAGYIEEAEVGDIFNTVTRQVFKEGVIVIPVLYTKQYLIWKDRKKGGGFRGSFNTIEEANARIQTEPENEQDDLEAVETGQQLVLVVNDDGTADEAVISMAKTKLKVSRQFNSLVKMGGGDRFSRTYRFFTADAANAAGEEYKNFAFSSHGFPEKEAYEKAESLYNALKTGARNMVVDTSDGGEADPTVGSGKEY